MPTPAEIAKAKEEERLADMARLGVPDVTGGLPVRSMIPIDEAIGPPAEGIGSVDITAAPRMPAYQQPPLIGQSDLSVVGSTPTHIIVRGKGGERVIARTPETEKRFAPGIAAFEQSEAAPPPMLARAQPAAAPGTGGLGTFMAGQKLRESALGHANDAIDAETEANKKLIGLESERQRTRGEGMQANAERQQNDLEVLQNQHEMALNQLEHERQGLLSQKVDPNRYWKEKSTGGKILTALGLALGSFGSALSHQPNYALDLYKKAIDDDINAQHAEINKSKDALSLRHNLIAERMKSGMSKLAADASARITMLDAADAMLMAQSGDAKGNLADVGAQKLHAYNEDQRGQLKQALGMALMQSAAAGAKGGGKQLPAETASKLGSAQSAIGMLDTLYTDWKQRASSLGSSIKQWISGTDAAKYNDARSAMVAHIGRALGERGTFSEKDAVRYYDALPSPTDTADRAEHKVKTVKSMMLSDFDAQIAVLGGAGFNVSGVPRPAVNFTPGAR